MLTEVLPARYRAVLYVVFAVVGVGFGATQVGYSAANAGQPTWLTVALAVYAFVGTAFGFTAAANTKAGAHIVDASDDPRFKYDDLGAEVWVDSADYDPQHRA